MLTDIKHIKMRAQLLRKIFFCASTVTIVICVFFSYRISLKSPNQKYNDTVKVYIISLKDFESSVKQTVTQRNANRTKFKYILQWTSPHNVPFNSMGVGQNGFISRNCSYTNCIVTSEQKYLSDITEFDVIVFAGPEVVYFPQSFLPKRRDHHQKYVFASIESSENYPVCSNRFDGFFNWTWTFRLDSEVRWGYMDVKDSSNKIIGPNKIMHWLELKDMEPVSEELKLKLKSKKKAAAWFVSNCFDKAGRYKFAEELAVELNKYNLELDIFGNCGKLSCPRSKDEICLKMLDDTYYFYLSFENSLSEDYVTEKLLKALQRNVVPVVFGGANYTRFMPKGIYLDARELGVKALAAKMADLIQNPEQYSNFFRWKNHYSYHSKHESPETNEYCQMCALLNDEKKFKETTILRGFRDWWDGLSLIC